MSRRHPHRRSGRKAIDLLKIYYDDGDGSFENIWAIAEWFRTEHRIRATYDQVSCWDRQARLERADELKATTFPSRRNGFGRQAQPTQAERHFTRAPRNHDTYTRLRNDEREAKAAAAQPDASPIERMQAETIRAARIAFAAAAGFNGDD